MVTEVQGSTFANINAHKWTRSWAAFIDIRSSQPITQKQRI